VDGSPYNGYLDRVEEAKLTLIKRAVPSEPPVGSYVELGNAFGNGASVWRRDTDGYRLAHQTTNSYTIPCEWSDFDYTRVRLLTKAAKPLS